MVEGEAMMEDIDVQPAEVSRVPLLRDQISYWLDAKLDDGKWLNYGRAGD